MSDPRDVGDPGEDEVQLRYLTDEERAKSDKVSAVQRFYRMAVAEKVAGPLQERAMRLGLSDVARRHLYEPGEPRTLCGLPRADNVSVNSALEKADDCAACRQALKR